MWPCEKISELTEFSSGRHDECLDNLKWNSCKWQSMHHRNVAGSSYITQVLVCIPQRIGNSWSLAKKTLWISVLSLTFYNPQALRWLAPNTRVIRSLTRPPITRCVRVEYPTRSTPSNEWPWLLLALYKICSSNLLNSYRMQSKWRTMFFQRQDCSWFSCDMTTNRSHIIIYFTKFSDSAQITKKQLFSVTNANQMNIGAHLHHELWSELRKDTEKYGNEQHSPV